MRVAQRYKQERLTYESIKDLATPIQKPPQLWTESNSGKPMQRWRSRRSKVRAPSGF